MKKDYTHFNLFEPKILPLHEVVENRNYQYPRFQRDFVWNTTKMKELIESIYHGYPVNSIYLWKRHGVVLKDRTESDEDSLLVIDGQQRLTTLRAILFGDEYRKGTQKRKIKIAFDPVAETFHEVNRRFTPSEEHIENIAQFYAKPDAQREAYLERNAQNLTPEQRETAIANLTRLEQIKAYEFIVYHLSNEVDIEGAYTCFERTNQAGIKVSQGDLCMSWLETYQPLLAEGIVIFGKGIQGEAYEESRAFQKTRFAKAIDWLKVDPPTNEPFQPKIGHIVELLFHVTQGGGKFQLGSIAQQLLKEEETPIGGKADPAKTKKGYQVETAFLSLVDATNYTRFNQIIRPFPSMNETDKKYAYWLYLQCVEEGKRNEEIARLLQRWYFLQLMSHMRKGGAAAISQYMKDFKASGGLTGYITALENEMKPDLWDETLPSKLEDSLSSDIRGKVLKAWTMVHVLSDDKALFDSSASIATLDREKSEHHIYPQKGLKDKKVSAGKMNAIANMAITTTEINSAIGAKFLHVYIFNEKAQGRLPRAEEHLTAHCIPERTGELEYEDFLAQRAKLMAKRFKDAYLALRD